MSITKIWYLLYKNQKDKNHCFINILPISGSTFHLMVKRFINFWFNFRNKCWNSVSLMVAATAAPKIGSILNKFFNNVSINGTIDRMHFPAHIRPEYFLETGSLVNVQVMGRR